MSEDTIVPLSQDEIDVLEMFSRRYQAAQIQAAMAADYETEYLERLRTKYGLDSSWTCRDTNVGFVKAGADDENN